MFFRRERGAEGFLDAWDSALRRNASCGEADALNLVARIAPVQPLKASFFARQQGGMVQLASLSFWREDVACLPEDLSIRMKR